MDPKELRGLYEAYAEVYAHQEIDEEEQIDEAEGSYGATPNAYGAARGTKMTAARKPFLRKMLSRTNPANRTDPYGSPRRGMTSDDRERARAGAAYGVGTRQDHDYPSQGPGGVTKSAKKLRKQKAMGEFAKEEFDIFDAVLEFLQAEGYAETLEEAEWMMANIIDEEAIDIIIGEEQLDEISDRTVSNALNKRIAATGAAADRAYMHRNPQAMRAAETAADKEARMKRAVKKRTARNGIIGEEQLDELSDRTVSNALNKRIANTGAASDRAYMHRNPQAMRAAETAADKEARMKRAVKKRTARLNKEEFEAWLDEAIYNYEKNLKRAAQRAYTR